MWTRLITANPWMISKTVERHWNWVSNTRFGILLSILFSDHLPTYTDVRNVNLQVYIYEMNLADMQESKQKMKNNLFVRVLNINCCRIIRKYLFLKEFSRYHTRIHFCIVRRWRNRQRLIQQSEILLNRSLQQPCKKSLKTNRIELA